MTCILQADSSIPSQTSPSSRPLGEFRRSRYFQPRLAWILRRSFASYHLGTTIFYLICLRDSGLRIVNNEQWSHYIISSSSQAEPGTATSVVLVEVLVSRGTSADPGRRI
ncbi:hypothetical protein BDR03DRAFT_591932 [Suillus americanus]|nr:hypothetical protein BDR03DRAFT_591932 [Suillus americanus]